MTKCSVLPRGLGTLPAGSAVRVKSRFRLYSVSGAALAVDRLVVRFAAVFTVRLTLVLEPRFAEVVAAPVARFPADRLVPVPALAFVPAFVPRFEADFFPRA